MASVLAVMVDRHLAEHPAIAANDEWSAMATGVSDGLHALYQAIGAVHLECAEDAEDERIAAEAFAEWEAAGRPPGVSHAEMMSEIAEDVAKDDAPALDDAFFAHADLHDGSKLIRRRSREMETRYRSAWDAGYMSVMDCLDGTPIRECPYAEGSPEHSDWEMGQIAAWGDEHPDVDDR
jgi:hypothetical protein